MYIIDNYSHEYKTRRILDLDKILLVSTKPWCVVCGVCFAQKTFGCSHLLEENAPKSKPRLEFWRSCDCKSNIHYYKSGQVQLAVWQQQQQDERVTRRKLWRCCQQRYQQGRHQMWLVVAYYEMGACFTKQVSLNIWSVKATLVEATEEMVIAKVVETATVVLKQQVDTRSITAAPPRTR